MTKPLLPRRHFVRSAAAGSLVFPVHDFHATILHLMGLEHEMLERRHTGLDFRLSGAEGANVVKVVPT